MNQADKPNQPSANQSKMGLVLTGGGARAAFQVGVLRAIFDLIDHKKGVNPFPIISGASAGAINATVLASHAQLPRLGIRSLHKVWAGFSVEEIFCCDFKSVMTNSGHWLRSFFSDNYHHKHHLGLLNNSPLKALLARVIHYDSIQEAIDNNQLHALSITASSYYSGQSTSFFQGHESIANWHRHRRNGKRCAINRSHLLASSAIPLVFPAQQIGQEFFGDGSVRFLSPLSPAIHLGADKIMVIGVDPVKEKMPLTSDVIHYPSTADIAGHVLDSVFVDSLDSDIERIKRVNKTIKLIPKAVRDLQSSLRPIETFTISPSQDLSALASKHFYQLPKLIQFFFKRVGIGASEGSNVLSYLLFESSYTQELIALGYADAMNQSDQIQSFMLE
jgi:NTE family protein